MVERVALTKEQVMEELSKFDISKTVNVDFSSDETKVVHDNGIAVKVGRKVYPLAPTGINSLVIRLNLPSSLPNKLSEQPDLLVHNLQTLSSLKNMQGKMLLRNGEVLSVVAPNALILPHEQVVNNIERRIKEVRFDKVFEDPPGVFNIHAFTGNGQQLDAGQGDYFKTGVKVVNSGLGLVQPSVSGYAVRLKCLNGAIAVDDLWRAPAKLSNEDGADWLDDSIRNARKVGKKFFAKIKSLKDIEIHSEHMDAFLESIYGDLGIPESVRDFISRRVFKEGADNMYDVFNHITYVASNYVALQEHPRFVNRLLTAGGALTNHAEVCPTCYRFSAN